MSDYKSIWLEPEPPMDDDEVGRMWCQDDVFDPYDYDGNKPTLYIRADLYKELQAQLEDYDRRWTAAEKQLEYDPYKGRYKRENIQLKGRVEEMTEQLKAVSLLPEKWSHGLVTPLDGSYWGAIDMCSDSIKEEIGVAKS